MIKHKGLGALDWVILWAVVVLAIYLGSAMYFFVRVSTQKAVVTYWEKKYNEEIPQWQERYDKEVAEIAKIKVFCKEYKRASICK